MPQTSVDTPRALSSSILCHKKVGDIRGVFYIAGYQRGYRWGREEVRHLLDDILSSGGKDYSLQPVVVKLRKAATGVADQEWELIDGQQRLTTIYLIMRYMSKELSEGIGAPYSVSYETRTDSRTYLHTIELATSGNIRNIDYFHMHGAYIAIDEWFSEHGDRYKRCSIASQLRTYLDNSIRVIWYEAPIDVAAIPLFTRLNVGRIPLTAAELIKAALLSAVRSFALSRAHEVASQWDAIERDLHDEDIWAFVAGLAGDDGEERYPTRISLLLDSLAAAARQPSMRHDRYHTFDTLQPQISKDWEGFWKSVVALHAQILGWYRLPKIYNKIGFLVMTGTSFNKFVLDSAKLRKTEFDQFLTDRIRTKVGMNAEGLGDLHYGTKWRELMDLLLLMNVETASRAGQRFPFAKYLKHKWSLEHIHAQHAEGLNKADQWKTWLRTHQVALRAVMAAKSADEVTALDSKITSALAQIEAGKPNGFSGDEFGRLSEEILNFLDDKQGPDHSIRNMALLCSAQNSCLNNSVFEVKRQMIIKMDQAGEFVPQCTRNVFLKYYADADAQQPHFWSEGDKSAYMREISATLHPYLT